mmetsp:Transcript_45544/g.73233  ORF Transcript_45544/g.73233 Transcript_45544/m.73233 type:complete len:181 (-) Transcript_45544:1202-1744(-)
MEVPTKNTAVSKIPAPSTPREVRKRIQSVTLKYLRTWNFRWRENASWEIDGDDGEEFDIRNQTQTSREVSDCDSNSLRDSLASNDERISESDSESYSRFGSDQSNESDNESDLFDEWTSLFGDWKTQVGRESKSIVSKLNERTLMKHGRILLCLKAIYRNMKTNSRVTQVDFQRPKSIQT